MSNRLVFYNRERHAESAFREAMRIIPENPHIRMGLATLLTELTRFDDAERELPEAIRLAPEKAANRSGGRQRAGVVARTLPSQFVEQIRLTC